MSSSDIVNEVKKALFETKQSLEASNNQTALALQNVEDNVISQLISRIDKLEGVSGAQSSFDRKPSLNSKHVDAEEKKTSQSSSTDDEDGVLDPVSIGDHMILNASELDRCGFLHGDLASVRVGLQESDLETNRDALNFSDFVFMVCPMLNYRQRNELDIAEAKQKNNNRKLGRKPSFNEIEILKSSLALLEARVSQEEANNAIIMNNVMNGEYPSLTLKYGDMFQLLHVKSGSFVTVLESAAPFDPECRGLTLDEKGSSAALFRFMPRFKAQTEGSIVYYSHSLRLASVKQHGYLVHVSDVPYSDIPEWRNSSLPKSLQTGKIFEANLATEPSARTSFKVSKYARFAAHQKTVLRTSDYFRLYHSQSESFIEASADPEKDRRNFRFPGVAVDRKVDAGSSESVDAFIQNMTHTSRMNSSSSGSSMRSMSSSSMNPRSFHQPKNRVTKQIGARENGDPCHIPFLKKLSDFGENPDPTDPTHQKVKSVWCFEPLRRNNADVLSWDKSVRIRHVPSGRYLAVDSDVPIKVDTSGQYEKWYRTFLVDDNTREEDDINSEIAMNIFDDEGRNLGFKTVEFSKMVFTVTAADVTSSNFVPDSNVSLRIEHTFKDKANGNGSVTLYLHNSEERKAILSHKVSITKKRNKQTAAAEATTTVGNDDEEAASKRATIIVKSYKLVFSSVRAAQDIFKLMSLSQREVKAIDMIKSLIIPCDIYTHSIKDYKKEIKHDFMNEVVYILLKVFNLQIKGTHDFSADRSIDWVKRANAMLPAAFSNIFSGGEPDKFIQRVCKDMKLMDSIFMMGKAAYERAQEAYESVTRHAAARQSYRHSETGGDSTAATAAAASIASPSSGKEDAPLLSSLLDMKPSTLRNPWNAAGIKNTSAVDMAYPKAIQKMIHVALQMMCQGNPNCQAYFGHRTSHSRLWMETILEQLEDPLGSAVTLSKLLSSNADMMKKYAEPNLVLRFLNMIRDLGPQPRLINFFEAICTVDGSAVKSNQEMILRLTWMNEENRNKAYLMTSNFDLSQYTARPSSDNIVRSNLQAVGGWKEYAKVSLPSGELSDGKVLKSNISKHPLDFIGKEIYESSSGFHPVFVKWFGADVWGQHMDALFWSPMALCLDSFDISAKANTIKGPAPEKSPKHGGKSQDMSGLLTHFLVHSKDVSGEWVRIEEFCWVLEPERLCEVITGQRWTVLQEKLKNKDSMESIMFNRQSQLVDYYVGQLNLLAKQCFGRSYNCIDWMQRSFSYDMLCSMCYNVYLPPRVRAAACDFVKNLYLDRYPQLVFCGKPSLPEQLWVYEISPSNQALLRDKSSTNKSKSNALQKLHPGKSGDRDNKESNGDSSLDIKNIPLIKPIELSEPGSLAEFAITKSHKFFGNNESIFYGFPTGFKFFLLRNVCNQYLASYGNGSIFHTNTNENYLANRIVSLISDLMSFGFQSSHVKIKDLLQHLVLLLDGRTDLHSENQPFFPSTERYRISPSSPQVTSLKATIVDILLAVTNLRANFRLAKIMQKFKEYNNDQRYQLEIKKIHALVVENKIEHYEGDFERMLYHDFEDLFVTGDGAALDLGVLSGGQNMDVILLDCLMYDDDTLFAKALTLLDRTYGQRRKLIDAVGEVTLLQQETVPVFGNVADMTSELGYLIFLVRSSEVWGVCSRVSGPFGPDKYEAVLRTCEKINEFILTEPIMYGRSGAGSVANSNSNVDVKQGLRKRPSQLSKNMDLSKLYLFGDPNQNTSSNETNRRTSNKKNGKKAKKGVASRKASQPKLSSLNMSDLSRNSFLSPKEFMNELEVDDRDNIRKRPYQFHQDVLRSMNIQTSLIEALNIDYNLSFKGSICTSEDRINSRNFLIKVQMKLVQSLCLFVKGNPKNQKVIFKHLKKLRNHLGLLKLPTSYPDDFTEEHKAQLITQPGMNTEMVLIECLRDNWDICESAVPRDLLEEFGSLLEVEPDPSTSHKLQLFKIMCQPVLYGRTIARNQEMVVDVLLSDNLPHLTRALELAFVIKDNYGARGLGYVDGMVSDESDDDFDISSSMEMIQEGSSCENSDNESYNNEMKRSDSDYSNMAQAQKDHCRSMSSTSVLGDTFNTSLMNSDGKGVPITSRSVSAVSDSSANSNFDSLSKPEHILDVLTATMLDKNIRCASKLQGKRFTIDLTIKSADKLLKLLLKVKGIDHSKEVCSLATRGYEEDLILGCEHFTSLLQFLSGQLEVLVLDPRLFRMEETWFLLCVGINRVISAILRKSHEANVMHREDEVNFDNVVRILLCACKISRVIVEGARGLGLQEKQIFYADDISDDEHSIYKSIQGLLESVSFIEKYPEVYNVMTELLTAITPVIRTGPHPVEDDLFLQNNFETADEIYRPGDSPPNEGEVEMLKHNAHDHASMYYFDEVKLKSEYVSPLDMLSYFHVSLKSNPLLVNKLMARKFQLVGILENAVNLTGSNGVKNEIKGSDGVASIQITWEQLMSRMVNYVREHNYDSDETTCLLILRIFRFHLLKVRSTEEGHEVEWNELSDRLITEYTEKQSSFVGFEVVEVALNAIATHPANIEGNLADECFELLLEMLNGGNRDVQTAVLHYIEHQDRDNKFLNHIKTRLLGSLVAIKERTDRTVNGFEYMTDENRINFKNCEQTLKFLQQLCEGHFLANQIIIREQATHSTSTNVLECAVAIFMSQCETSSMLIEMEEAEVELLITSLELLIETVQGPCPGNQEFLVLKDGFPNCLDKIIQSNFHPRVDVLLKMQVKSTALKLLESCLEGRTNLTLHTVLAAELDPAGFELFRKYTNNVLAKSQKSLEVGHLQEEEFRSIEEFVLSSFSSVKSVVLELRLLPSFKKKCDVIDREKKGLKADLLDEVITTIEIAWKDRIESVSFPIPKDVFYLTVKTREDFLLETDLSTAEKRMKSLLSQAPVFMAEMQQIYTLSEKSNIYLFIHHNIVNIKWSMYALVVLLNLNIIMASYGEGSKDGYPSIQSGLKGLHNDDYAVSLYISLTLALLNLMGYVVIVAFLAVTEVPIIIRQMDDFVETSLNDLKMKEDEYRDAGAFKWWFVTLIFNVLFIIMHLSNYPGKENEGLYLFLVLGINLPWTLSCVRNYIVVPNTPQTRIFCVIYDVVITKPFFRNHVLLMVCSINGFTQSSWFPLMLMDIMNNSKLLANVARSVTDNMLALSLVFYLFVCTVAIYAQFGLEYFEDWFVYESDDDEIEDKGCHSVVSCFVLIFYMGVPSGSLSDVLDSISNRHKDVQGQTSNTYLQRVIFDLSFFIWVGILLFNIITGLMVDGFGALREEDNIRQDILENTCFVCGFTRSAYDDIPNFQGPTFDQHKTIDHEFWVYVYYYVYLKRKDKTELSGVESYVWQQIHDENNSLMWIPVRQSSAIQNSVNENKQLRMLLREEGKGSEGPQHTGDGVSESGGSSSASATAVQDLSNEVAEMKQLIQTLLNKKD